MIDLDEYDCLFQKIEELFEGLAAPDHEHVDTGEKDKIVEQRRDLYPSSVALADERDDYDTSFDFLKETEDKISSELLELNDLMRSGSKDDRSKREMPDTVILERERRLVEARVRRSQQKRNDTTDLDKAILKQLEAFRVSGSTKTDSKNPMDKHATMQVDKLRQISGWSQDDVHILRSNSETSLHEETQNSIMHEEEVEVAIFHGDMKIEIDEFDNVRTSERGLKTAYPLEFPGRSPSPPKCPKSLLFRDPSISSASSDESSLLWLGEELEV